MRTITLGAALLLASATAVQGAPLFKPPSPLALRQHGLLQRAEALTQRAQAIADAFSYAETAHYEPAARRVTDSYSVRFGAARLPRNVERADGAWLFTARRIAAVNASLDTQEHKLAAFEAKLLEAERDPEYLRQSQRLIGDRLITLIKKDLGPNARDTADRLTVELMSLRRQLAAHTSGEAPLSATELDAHRARLDAVGEQLSGLADRFR
jgi:hypothetical protein